MKNSERNHQRSENQTVLGVTMDKSLKEKIKAAADLETRSMANFAVYYLMKAVEEIERRRNGTKNEGG